MIDLTPYKAGLDAAFNNTPQSYSDPRSAFMSLLSAAGFTPPRTLKIGAIDRIDGTDDKRGKKSGWYIYNEIEDTQADSAAVVGVASYGDWKTGINETWSSRADHQMNDKERAAYHAKREAMRIAREQEEIRRHEEAAKTAFEIWSNAPDAESHPYLEKKGVKSAQGLKLHNDGRLIIPIAIENQIVSLQFIDKDGGKRFLTGGKLKGGWFMIEGESQTIYIAEGYSTAFSIYQATGSTVYVSFNANNLYEIAAFVKNKHLDSRIIITGDDDTKGINNIGRIKAEQTAQGLGLELIFPEGFNDFCIPSAQVGQIVHHC